MSKFIRIALVSFSAVACAKKENYSVVSTLSASTMELMNEIRFYQARIEKKGRSDAAALDLAYLAEAYFKQGRLTGSPRDLETAETLARESIRKLPTFNVAAKTVLARVLENRHHFEEAIATATDALKDRGDAVGAFAVLVTSNLALGRLTEAAKAADILSSAHPSSQNYALAGVVRAAQGRVDEARYSFERALAYKRAVSRDERVWALNAYARFLLDQGEPGAAGEVLTRAHEVYPQQHFTLALEGERAQLEGDPARAADRFMAAFRIARDAHYLRLYGRAQRARGRATLAADAFREAEALVRAELARPNGTGHRLELVKLLLERDDAAAIAEALPLIDAELKARQTAEVQLVYAQVLRRAGKTASALQMAQASLRSGWRNADAFFEAGALYGALGDVTQADFYLRQALATQPRHRAAAGAVWELAHLGARAEPKRVAALFTR